MYIPGIYRLSSTRQGMVSLSVVCTSSTVTLAARAPKLEPFKVSTVPPSVGPDMGLMELQVVNHRELT